MDTVQRTRLAPLRAKARRIKKREALLEEDRQARNDEIVELAQDDIPNTEIARAAEVGESYVRKLIDGKAA